MAVTQKDLRADTSGRILDAAFESISDFGLSRVTVEDVAGRAGLSRQTVYRYFESKDQLIVALVSKEEERFLDGVRAAFMEHEDLEGALESSTRFVLRYAREHPLLDRLLATDQATFLPYVTTRALPLVVRAREVLVELIRIRLQDVDVDVLRGVVDVTTRAIMSYILTPSDRSPEEIGAAFSRVVGALPVKEGVQ